MIIPSSQAALRTCVSLFHVVVRAGNTARGLTFERVQATGVYRAAASVESWGEPTVADVVFRDVQIANTGGGTAEDAKLAVRRPGVDARKLPAWGFFVRGVHDLTLDRVSLDLREPDRRPVLMADGVQRLRLRECRYPEPPAGVEPLTLTHVERLERE